MYGRFLSDLRTSRLPDDYLKKEITLCRAGAGRTILASDRRPAGFAGKPSWGISSFVQAGLWIWLYRQVFALMEQTSRKPVLGTVLEWFWLSAPSNFGSQPRLSWSTPSAGLEIAE